MSKIWSHVAAFLGGALLVAIIFAKWFIGDDYTMEVKKIKNKRTSGITTTTVPMQMITGETKLSRKERRKAKRNEK